MRECYDLGASLLNLLCELDENRDPNRHERRILPGDVTEVNRAGLEGCEILVLVNSVVLIFSGKVVLVGFEGVTGIEVANTDISSDV